MKLNRIALAVALVAPAMTAQAGISVTPLLLGYHYTGMALDEMRDTFFTNKQLVPGGALNGGIYKKDGLYTGVALGVELTPSIIAEIEYGIARADGQASKASGENPLNRFDIEQRNLTANVSLNSDFITQNYSGSFKPYILVGAGQADYQVQAQRSFASDSPKGRVNAGDKYNVKNTIGNFGLGAYYRLNDAVSLRGEGRAVYNFTNEWVEGLALAGLNVVLGGHLLPNIPTPPEPEPEEPTPTPQPTGPDVVIDQPVDSDGDGVVDGIDRCPNTPRNTIVDANGCPKRVIEDLRMELRVFFDNNKSAIKAQYKPEIAKVAQKMRQYPNAVARVEGHASKTGPSAKYNQRLSERRARAVKAMLSNKYGISPNRISTKGFGYNRPIAPNNTPEGRAMNRRVYAIITGTK